MTNYSIWLACKCEPKYRVMVTKEEWTKGSCGIHMDPG